MFSRQLNERQIHCSRFHRFRGHVKVGRTSEKLPNTLAAAKPSVPLSTVRQSVDANRLSNICDEAKCRRFTLPTLSSVSCMALAPSPERYLLVGGWDHTLELFDLNPAPKSYSIPEEVLDESPTNDPKRKTRRKDWHRFEQPSELSLAERRKRNAKLLTKSYAAWQEKRHDAPTVFTRPKRLWFSIPRSKASRQRIARATGIRAPWKQAQRSTPSAVRWIPENTSMFVSATCAGALRMWDTNTLQPIANFSLGEDNHISDIDFGTTAHQNLIGVASNCHDLLLYDPRSNELAARLPGCNAEIMAARWKPCSPFQIAAGSAAGTVLLFDIRSNYSPGQRLGTPAPTRWCDMDRVKRGDFSSNAPPLAHNGVVKSLSFTSDGAYLLSAGSCRMRLWAVHGFAEPCNTLTHYQYTFPDVASGGGNGIALAEPGHPLVSASSSFSSRKRCVVFHPGLAAGSYVAFELFSGHKVRVPGTHQSLQDHGVHAGGHVGRLSSIVYRRSHHQILGASSTAAVTFWDGSGSMQRLSDNIAHNGGGHADAFDPDEEEWQ